MVIVVAGIVASEHSRIGGRRPIVAVPRVHPSVGFVKGI